jgi:UDP-2,4-diacetamido-2,4,6-trideoxy-beta-L-altropyranose hydrolase
MTVVFRVDSSSEIGTGHVMRCLALAEGLKQKGNNVEFICRKHKGNLIENIKATGFSVAELEVSEENKCDNKLAYSNFLGTTQQQDATECSNILQQIKPDWLIVDHYAIDKEWEQLVSPYCEKLMVIDDLADRKHLCDLLLDQTFGRQQQDYEMLVPTSCELLLGSQYALLRPEFAKWRPNSLERRSKLEFKQLLINMGGVDINNVTAEILNELKTCDVPNDINIVVVMGESAPHLENIRAIASTFPYKTVVKVDVDNMAEIMANADMAIGAAGATTWERCCLGLPTIQIVIAENQNTIAKYLVKKNAIKLLKDRKELSSMISDVTGWMKNVSEIARQITDGLGSKRVVNAIIDKK